MLVALAILLITSCAEATEPTNQPGAIQDESTPVPAATETNSDSESPVDSVEPTLVPAATLAPIEAQSTLSPNEPTPAAIRSAPATITPLPGRSDSAVEGAEAATPVPTPNVERPTPTSTPVVAVPDALKTPVPTATAVPTATNTPPTTTPIPAPTPRPTPGPISRSTNFVPLDEPAYVSRENASSNITNASYVLGVANNGEARAYPLDMMWYHHIANDTVGGEPWLVTY